MTLEDLGRRAVACKHWRWMEGMAALDIGWDQEGFTTWRDPETGELVSKPWTRGKWRTRGPFRLISDLDIYDGEEVLPLVKRTAVPDLSDPATLGCLLVLVRRAWNGNVVPVYPDSKEALTKLVAALEAAP
jgi:hypothetical protein